MVWGGGGEDRGFTRGLAGPNESVGEGNGTPLQCSSLENPRDGEPGRLQSMGPHKVGQD